MLETSGNISFYYYSDEDVKYGLPILPKVYATRSMEIKSAGIYACTYCCNTEKLSKGQHVCKRCQKKEWVVAINTCRLS